MSTPLRISDTPEWPPTILFDAVYAGTVLHHFGTKALKDEVTVTWKNIFHPGGVMTAGQADYQKILNQRAAEEQMSQEQGQECKARLQTRLQARSVPDAFDTLMVLPYIRVPQNDLEAAFRQAEEKAVATQQRYAREKVDAWMKQSSVV